MLSDFNRKPLSHEVLTFMGEFLEEDKNKPVQGETTGKWSYVVPDKKTPCDRNLISRTLDLYRGRFDGSVGYGVYNLVEILKLVRKDLIASNLTKLDLSYCTFNNIILGKKSIGADLSYSRLSRNCFFPASINQGGRLATFSPNDQHILVRLKSEQISIWDAKTNMLLDCIGENIDGFVFSNTGKFLALFSKQNASIYSTNKYQKIFEMESKGISGVIFSPHDELVIIISNNGTASVLSTRDFFCKYNLEGHSNGITSASFSYDGKYVVTASYDKTIIVWNTFDGTMHKKLVEHSDTICDVIFCKNKSNFISYSKNEVIVWDIISFKIIHKIKDAGGKCGLINKVVLSPNDDIFLICYDWIAKAIRLSDFMVIGELNERLKAFSFSPNGLWLATISYYGNFSIRNTSDMKLKVNSSIPLLSKKCDVNSLNFSNDGKTLIASSYYHIYSTYNFETLSIRYRITCSDSSVLYATYSPNCQYIAIAGSDRTVKIFNADSHILVGIINTQLPPIYSICSCLFSPDSQRILLSAKKDDFSKHGTVQLWDVETLTQLHSWEQSDYKAIYASYSSCQKYIFTVSENSIDVWDSSTYQLVKTVLFYDRSFISASYCAKGTYILIVTSTHKVYIFDARSLQILNLFEDDIDPINKAVFSSSGRYIVTASQEQLCILDTKSGTLVKTSRKLMSINSVSFSSNEQIVMVGSSELGVIAWLWKDNKIISIEDNSHGKIFLTEKNSSWHTELRIDNCKLISCSYNIVKEWDLSSENTCKWIPNTPGLYVSSCRLIHLHPDSQLSEEDKAILKQYGAVLD